MGKRGVPLLEKPQGAKVLSDMLMSGDPASGPSMAAHQLCNVRPSVNT